MHAHIAVAGAGLIGRLLAWKLLQAGHRVSLFDRGSHAGETGAARVAAAMIAPYSELVSAEPVVFERGRGALAWWRRELAALCEETGVEIVLGEQGSIVVAHPRDRADLARFEQQLVAKLPRPDEAVQRLSREELAGLEPELGDRFDRGLLLRGEGYLDNWALLDALHRAILARGARWQASCAVHETGPYRLRTDDGGQRFDAVVDTRGLGASEQIEGLRGVRGEVLWVDAPEVGLSRPVRLMHPRYSLYVSPRPRQRYVIGATEIESESTSPVTVRSYLELLSALYSVHAGFAEANVAHAFAACRPAMPDNLPVVRAEPGLLRVNGLYRHGYLLAPSVVDEALAVLDTVLGLAPAGRNAPVETSAAHD